LNNFVCFSGSFLSKPSSFSKVSLSKSIAKSSPRCPYLKASKCMMKYLLPLPKDAHEKKTLHKPFYFSLQQEVIDFTARIAGFIVGSLFIVS
jgi:hypothetical protein